MIAQQMAKALGLPQSHVEGLAHAASHSYKQYTIKKVAGGTRTIHHPSKALKSLQRWLNAEVVSSWPLHSSAMAYRKGKSILDNAAAHRHSNYLLRMDFSDFFGSIKDTDVDKYIWTRPMQFTTWSQEDIEIFKKIVFRYGSLTIGAPTSPSVANALCFDMDAQLFDACSKLEVIYTRYADDLFFSTTHPDILGKLEDEVSSIVAVLTLPSGLSLNVGKTRHSSRKGARRVTGIVLGSDGETYIGRDLKRRIRAMLHKYATLTVEDRERLKGLLGYATGLDPDFKNSLITKYGLGAVRQAFSFTKTQGGG
jgi:RNA-directed DNA polymerase